MGSSLAVALLALPELDLGACAALFPDAGDAPFFADFLPAEPLFGGYKR
ncbi:hypothetical protein [Pseudoalteromonas atlantica]